MLYVGQSEGKGRGVFTDSPIKRGEMIEMSPVIVFPKEDAVHIDKTKLTQYWFNWFGDGSGVIGLGLLSLYNHSDEPNAEYIPFIVEEKMIISCIRDIEPGQEILINYKNKRKFNFD